MPCSGPPRTGKSRAIIENIEVLKMLGSIDTAIIIAPNMVHFQWAEHELPLYADTEDDMVCVWNTKKANTKPWIANAKSAIKHDGFSWFILSTSILITQNVRNIINLIYKRRSSVFLCVDESHDFRTPRSKRSQMMRAVAKRSPFVRILTGTPIANSPLHAWAQFELLSPACLGYSKYRHFKYEYTEYSESRTLTYRNLSRLWKSIKPFSSTVTREDCVDLPEATYETIKISLSNEQQDYTTALIKKCRIAVDEGLMTATHAYSRIARLQQIASGYLVMDGTDEIVPLKENPKLPTVLAEIEKRVGNVIIWCRFTYDINMLVARLTAMKTYTVVMLKGGMSAAARLDAIATLNAPDPDKRVVLVGQPQAGGVGLDLSGAGSIIWYSHTWDAIIRKQANERATKIKGNSPTIVDICAGMIDSMILSRHGAKGATVDNFMDVIQEVCGDF